MYSRKHAPITVAVLIISLCVTACSGGGGGSSGSNAAIPPTTSTAPPSAPNGPSFTINGSPVKISEFPIVGDTNPIGITVAGDGNAWFLSMHHVNRITPSGVITSFISVTGEGGRVPAIDPYSPQNDITVGPDKALWFTADNNDQAVQNPLQCLGPPSNECNNLGRISSNAAPGTLADVVAVFDRDTQHISPVNFPPTGVVSGPNGEVWVESCSGATDPGVDCPFGMYQSFKTNGALDIKQDLPNLTQGINFPQCPIGELFCGYNSLSIAKGSDGAIYIVAIFNTVDNGLIPGSEVVFRINAQGKITNTFPVPDAHRITNGPDGNLWITQAGATNAIARMTTSGAITEFPVLNANPLGIAAGNDGAIWFTEVYPASKIGRITTSGVITEYPTPTANSNPMAIASLEGECGTGHGRIWFTEANANKIGRIDF